MENTVYKIGLPALLQILQTFQQTGTLSTQVPSDMLKTTSACVAFITLTNGTITSSMIQTTDGKPLLRGNSALLILSSLKSPVWLFTAQEPPSSPSDKPPVPSSSHTLVPQRLTHVTQTMLNQWSRKHRAVYLVIDDRKTVGEIATLLSLPIETVEAIIRDFQSINIVTLA